MPATIVETNKKPLKRVEIDPVTLDIIENALRNARIEMDATLVRTAMSPGIREHGDQLHFITWGGGGWGDPLERDPALVGKEIVQGLVTAAGAKANGVVANNNGDVDGAATEALRTKMYAERAEVSLFNYGPSIDVLRANCEVVTGLMAPIQPVWNFAGAAK